jgi:hypothetical protein
VPNLLMLASGVGLVAATAALCVKGGRRADHRLFAGLISIAVTLSLFSFVTWAATAIAPLPSTWVFVAALALPFALRLYRELQEPPRGERFQSAEDEDENLGHDAMTRTNNAGNSGILASVNNNRISTRHRPPIHKSTQDSSVDVGRFRERVLDAPHASVLHTDAGRCTFSSLSTVPHHALRDCSPEPLP